MTPDPPNEGFLVGAPLKLGISASRLDCRIFVTAHSLSFKKMYAVASKLQNNNRGYSPA